MGLDETNDTAEVAVAAWQIVRLRPVSLTWHGTASKEQTESDSPSWPLPSLCAFSRSSSIFLLAHVVYRSLFVPYRGPRARAIRVRDRALLESV
jgi:hypothetical protein